MWSHGLGFRVYVEFGEVGAESGHAALGFQGMVQAA